MPLLAPASPDPFAAAADLISLLPTLTKPARVRIGITSKVQAVQIGISHTTLTRFEAGSIPSQSTTVAVLRWLSSRS